MIRFDSQIIFECGHYFQCWLRQKALGLWKMFDQQMYVQLSDNARPGSEHREAASKFYHKHSIEKINETLILYSLF